MRAAASMINFKPLLLGASKVTGLSRDGQPWCNAFSMLFSVDIMLPLTLRALAAIGWKSDVSSSLQS